MLQRCTAVIMMLCAAMPAMAQHWPYDIKTADGTITVYEPQPQSLSNNKLSAMRRSHLQQAGRTPYLGPCGWML